MDRLLRVILQKLIRTGTLRITTAQGSTFTFGDGTGMPVADPLHRLGLPSAVFCLIPSCKFGEAYMHGAVVIEQGSIADALALVSRQPGRSRWPRPRRFIRYLRRRVTQFNSPRQARRNVAHHYDLDSQLYALFLDADRQYSCAYFELTGQSLDDAQLAKKRHLAAKLLTAPGQRVLDIGCGWGGLALYLTENCGARRYRHHALDRQLEVARMRAVEKGLSDGIDFRLQDYRDLAAAFRSHRLGRHVRACRRRLLRYVFPQMRSAPR